MVLCACKPLVWPHSSGSRRFPPPWNACFHGAGLEKQVSATTAEDYRAMADECCRWAHGAETADERKATSNWRVLG